MTTDKSTACEDNSKWANDMKTSVDHDAQQWYMRHGGDMREGEANGVGRDVGCEEGMNEKSEWKMFAFGQEERFRRGEW